MIYKYEKFSYKLKAKVMSSIKNNGVNCFWWSGRKNFGDLLTKELLLKYDVTPIPSNVADAQICGVGSILHILPNSFSGLVMGSGCIDEKPYHLPNAIFRLVRGALSIQNLGIDNDTPIGDPGLLANKLSTNLGCKKRYEIGIVPHFVDKENDWVKKTSKHLGSSCHVINVEDTAKSVTNQINECEIILSSSLHGIIVADALNIPNVWVELSDKVIGDGFKFHDYNTALDYEQTPIKIKSDTKINHLINNRSNKNVKLIEEKQMELDKIFIDTLAKFQTKQSL